MPRTALMSIRAQHADALYAGRKLHEYRRCSTAFASGDEILVYEPHPRRHVSGHFLVGRVAALRPPYNIDALEIDEAVVLGVTLYLKGAARATAIEIIQPKRFETPWQLQHALPRRRAPQSYLFLTADDGLLRGNRES